MPYNRREFIRQAGAASALCALTGFQPQAEDAGERPANVVVVMSDEHNPFVSSLHNHPLVETPNMTRLAARGTVFENTYCPSPLCLPCRSAFMAGRRVHELQTYSNCNVISHEYPSYGRVLEEQGVHSVLMGKVDVYRPSGGLGFSEVILPGDRKRPGDTNFARTPLAIRSDGASRAKGYGPRDAPFGGDTRCTNAAMDWLRRRPQELNKPFVMFVGLVKPHFPHYVTADLWAKYEAGANLPEYGRDEPSANHPYALDLRAHFQTDQFSDEDIRGLRRGYLGCVEFIDQQLGRIMDCLDEQGLSDNTVLAYASDHGEMLGKFGLWWKSSLYDDSARVPLIVAGPGFEAGARASTPVDLLDLQATMFHATGAKRPEGWTGVPLQEIPLQDDERVVFAEYHGHGTRSGAFLIRKGPWKLIYNMAAPHQLFNLAEDPSELNNLAEEHPAKLHELEKELRRICSPENENNRAHAFEQVQQEAIDNPSA